MTALAIIYLALVVLTLPITSTAGEDSAGYVAASWLLFVCSPVGMALAIVAIA